MAACDEQVFACKLQTVVVVLSASHLFHFAISHIHAENRHGALVRADEIDILFVGRPSDEVHAVIPVGGEVHFLVAVEHEDAVFVGLVAIVLH